MPILIHLDAMIQLKSHLQPPTQCLDGAIEFKHINIKFVNVVQIHMTLGSPIQH